MWTPLVAPLLAGGLTLRVFDNTAVAGDAAYTTVVPSSYASINQSKSKAFSATLTGLMNVERGYEYNFTCTFGGASLGYAHIDGHLICQTGVNYPHAPAGPSVRSVAYDNPLPVLSSMEWPVRFTMVSNGSDLGRGDDESGMISFGIHVSRSPAHHNKYEAPHTFGVTSFSPALPKAEAARDAMQAALAKGWAPWYDMSYTKLVRLPEGSVLTLALCEASDERIGAEGNAMPSMAAAKCALETRTDWAPDDGMGVVLRLGAHATDRSYAQLFVATPTCNVSMEMTGGDALVASVRVVRGCERAELVLVGGTAWHRMHTIRVVSPTLLRFEPYGSGVRASDIYSTAASAGSLVLPAAVALQPHLAIPLGSAGSGVVGLSSGEALDLRAIEARLEAAWSVERRKYEPFGALSEVKMAVQAGCMWNTIYNPIESVIAPVIRGNPWGWDTATVDDDWAYVLFDWDTHFASYMLSLDADAKAIGYSILIQIVKAKSARGFVPNGWAPTRKSTHSQPPVGAKVLHEMYTRYRDLWLVELLYDDLKDWSDWFEAERRLAPLNLTALGGDDMQAARYESGLDNSPMYDGEFFASNRPSGFGLMQMYDVGMASMVAMSDDALASLASVLGRERDASLLRRRSRSMRAKIGDHLWDSASGAFVNRFANGTFNRRISPTSFYPMLAGAATAERATALMTGWLMNASRFCVSPRGDFVGNSDDCYWGLPSISADDAAFPALGYWRGFVWGPMALLTYWSLSHPAYAALPAVAQARAALCAQMAALFLRQWRLNRHVCENFSPKRNATECTGMHFYHWGGLAGFISLLDAGFYAATSATAPRQHHSMP